eukprot:4809929-Amphidinium_carterae.2
MDSYAGPSTALHGHCKPLGTLTVELRLSEMGVYLIFYNTEPKLCSYNFTTDAKTETSQMSP